MSLSLSFDRQTDALAIVFSDSPVARTIDAGDGRLLDLDADGRLVGLEILGASRQSGVSLTDLADAEQA